MWLPVVKCNQLYLEASGMSCFQTMSVPFFPPLRAPKCVGKMGYIHVMWLEAVIWVVFGQCQCLSAHPKSPQMCRKDGLYTYDVIRSIKYIETFMARTHVCYIFVLGATSFFFTYYVLLNKHECWGLWEAHSGKNCNTHMPHNLFLQHSASMVICFI